MTRPNRIGSAIATMASTTFAAQINATRFLSAARYRSALQ